MKRVQIAVLAVAVAGSGSVAAQSNAPTPPGAVLAPAPPPPPGKTRPAVPQGNPASWISMSDYPALALREAREGVTGFRLVVSERGFPAECAITVSSGSSDLDAATCANLLRRARFRPALDVNGRATSGSFSSRVRWFIPKEPTALEPMERKLTFTVEKDGTVINCVETQAGRPILNSFAKTLCSSGNKVMPYTDANGAPVRKQVIIVQSVTVGEVPN